MTALQQKRNLFIGSWLLLTLLVQANRWKQITKGDISFDWTNEIGFIIGLFLLVFFAQQFTKLMVVENQNHYFLTMIIAISCFSHTLTNELCLIFMAFSLVFMCLLLSLTKTSSPQLRLFQASLLVSLMGLYDSTFWVLIPMLWWSILIFIPHQLRLIGVPFFGFFVVLCSLIWWDFFYQNPLFFVNLWTKIQQPWFDQIPLKNQITLFDWIILSPWFFIGSLGLIRLFIFRRHIFYSFSLFLAYLISLLTLILWANPMGKFVETFIIIPLSLLTSSIILQIKPLRYKQWIFIAMLLMPFTILFFNLFW